MPKPTFTRRTFLTASSLGLFAPEILANILKGPSPTHHGQRDRDTWLGATALEGVRLGPKRGDMQAVFFIDLNCPACVQLWRWFDRPEHVDWVTLWVPVSYMHATSTGKGAALLRANNPRGALAQNFGMAFNGRARRGGLEPVPDPAPTEVSSIRANTHFWRSSLFEGTPLTLYRGRNGTFWQLLGQLPEAQMDGAFMELAPASLPAFQAQP